MPVPPTPSATSPSTHSTGTRYGQLDWQDGQPLSATFGDVYFSRASGIEETRHVFLQHNGLAERWASLPDNSDFIIGETGFGTGLNFLCAAQLWLTTAPTSCRLHFVSAEKFPLTPEDLAQALALWPELSELSSQLLAAYPVHFEREVYRLTLLGGRLQLTLLIDDAAHAFGQLIHRQHPDFVAPKIHVDAWFLDGFAPSKNPDMWTGTLFTHLAWLSGPDTSLATFTSAGLVRRGLQSAGFAVQKVQGYGHKREMLTARFAGPAPRLTIEPARTPWHQFPVLNGRRRALVIGAGLAGAHTARALAEQGWQVTVCERNPQPALEASGNRQGIVYAKLSAQRQPQSRFNLAALQYALPLYCQFWQQRPAEGDVCGVLQLTADPTESARLAAAAQSVMPALAQPVTAEQASQLAGLPLSQAGLFMPGAGWLNPPALCRWLLDHPAIDLHTGQPVQALQFRDDHWQVQAGAQTHLAELVVVCCAQQARQFPQLAELPLKPIRGQVTHLPAQSPLDRLQTVVTGEGYLAPVWQEQQCLGASFNLGDDNPELTERDQQANLALLADLCPATSAPQLSGLAGKVGFRCTAPDYLPLAGPAPNTADWLRQYAELAHNARKPVAATGAYWPGLYVNLALGSRGLVYAPLCAQLIAAQASRLPLPLHEELAQALNPARFLMRDLIRGKRVAAASSTLQEIDQEK